MNHVLLQLGRMPWTKDSPHICDIFAVQFSRQDRLLDIREEFIRIHHWLCVNCEDFRMDNSHGPYMRMYGIDDPDIAMLFKLTFS